MPATNREGVQLGHSSGIAPTTGDYLRGLSPSWTTIAAGLALFVILYLLASRARFGRTSSRTWENYNNSNLPCQSSLFMDEKTDKDSASQHGMRTGKSSKVELKNDISSGTKKPLAIDLTWERAGGTSARQVMSRTPPAPPLTPPEVSTAVFTFEDRPRGHETFLQQSDHDYLSSTSTSMSQLSSTSPTSRRRSYNKTVPIGIPTPQTSSASEVEPVDLVFSPSSYPPTSPLLPPAPPSDGEEEHGSKVPREIDVHGDILSVVDDDGAGWTRHTRVYGGGVCLACAASGGDHSGGFYGATVRPEEMR
jgi:hypothetical protein